MLVSRTSHSSEVNLGLESKDGESQYNGSTHTNSHQNLICTVASCHSAQHEALSQCEQSQKDEIVRSLPSDSLTASQSDEGHKEYHHGNDPHLRMLSSIQLDRLQGEDTNYSHRHYQLQSQHI